MAFMTLRKIVFKNLQKLYLSLPIFLFFCLLPTYSQYRKVAFRIIDIQERLNWTNFEGQKMALRLRQRFIASLFEFLFVISICCSFCDSFKIFIFKYLIALL